MKNLFQILNFSQKKRGYTLLFSVLTAAMVLGVATFILSVSRKQIVLASAARESLNAFYAADSGIECITSKQNESAFFSTDSPHNITCGVQAAPETFPANPNDTYTDAYGNTYPAYRSNQISLTFAPACALLSLIVVDSTDSLGQPVQFTVVQSRGYNLCDFDAVSGGWLPISTPKIVERALQISYR